MLFLWILVGLPLFILLLLVVQIRVRIECYNGWWQIRARYGPFWYTANPDLLKKRQKKAALRKAKKEAKRTTGAKSPKAENKKEPTKKKGETDLRELLKTGRQLLRSARAATAMICRHFIIDKPRVALAVGGGDAHKTALAYAKVAAALAIGTEILDELFVLQDPKVGVVPDFTKPGVRYDISVTLRFRPIIAAAAGVWILFRLLRLLLSRRALKQTVRKVTHKGGSQHESAASY